MATPVTQLPDQLGTFQLWLGAKSDLYQWVKLLDRFDEILEDIVKQYGLDKHVQHTAFDVDTKRLLQEVLRFTALLLENSINRFVYSSCAYLNDFLGTSDMEVLEAALLVIFPLAVRIMANPRSNATRAAYEPISQERMLKLAATWYDATHYMEQMDMLSLPRLADDTTDFTQFVPRVAYKFFRTLGPQDEEDKIEEVSPGPSVSKIARIGSSSTSTLSSPPVKGRSKLQEGVVEVFVSEDTIENKDTGEICRDVIVEYDLPASQEFNLLLQVNFAKSLGNSKIRQLYLSCRLLAIANFHLTMPTDVISRVLNIEQDNISRLSAILSNTKHVAPLIIDRILTVIDAVVRNSKYRITDVISATISSNSGVWRSLLEDIYKEMDTCKSISYSFLQHVDIVFSFLGFVTLIPVSCNQLRFAGLFPIAVHILNCQNAVALPIVRRCVNFLDSFVFRVQGGFELLYENAGLDELVARIAREVEVIRLQAMDTDSDSYADIENPPPIQKLPELVDGAEYERQNSERLQLLRVLFRFVSHMMTLNEPGNRMRNLIESALLPEIKIILKHRNLFKAANIAIVSTIISTLINNEPASYIVLREQGIPQDFLNIFQTLPAPNAELICSLPHIFGAFCLNQQGLEYFKKHNPIEAFFGMMSSLPHASALIEADFVSNLGPMMDELSRHHPDLKKDIFKGLHTALRAVIAAGKSPKYATTFRMPRYYTNDATPTHVSIDASVERFTEPSFGPANTVEKIDVPSSSVDGGIILLIDNLARVSLTIKSFVSLMVQFMYGYFQNSNITKELVQEDFIVDVLELVTLPSLPYDFARSEAYDMLRHCLKLLMDTSGAISIKPILLQLKQALLAHDSLDERVRTEAASGRKYIYMTELPAILDASTPDYAIDMAQRKVSAMTKILNLVVLVADIYMLPAMGSNRYHATLFEPLSPNSKIGTDDLLYLLGDFYR